MVNDKIMKDSAKMIGRKFLEFSKIMTTNRDSLNHRNDDTVDGSEIPNNYLGSTKPCK